jgi:hypothetical protein
VATTEVLPLLPKKPRYPNLGTYPKYGDFTLLIEKVIISSSIVGIIK